MGPKHVQQLHSSKEICRKPRHVKKKRNWYSIRYMASFIYSIRNVLLGIRTTPFIITDIWLRNWCTKLRRSSHRWAAELTSRLAQQRVVTTCTVPNILSASRRTCAAKRSGTPSCFEMNIGISRLKHTTCKPSEHQFTVPEHCQEVLNHGCNLIT